MTEQDKSANELARKTIKYNVKNDAMIVVECVGIPSSGKSVLRDLREKWEHE